MFKDKHLRKLLAGNCDFQEGDFRSISFTFPSKEDGEPTRQITYAAHDGLILYFIKRFEKLENRIAQLETKRK